MILYIYICWCSANYKDLTLKVIAKKSQTWPYYSVLSTSQIPPLGDEGWCGFTWSKLSGAKRGEGICNAKSSLEYILWGFVMFDLTKHLFNVCGLTCYFLWCFFSKSKVDTWYIFASRCTRWSWEVLYICLPASDFLVYSNRRVNLWCQQVIGVASTMDLLWWDILLLFLTEFLESREWSREKDPHDSSVAFRKSSDKLFVLTAVLHIYIYTHIIVIVCISCYLLFEFQRN